MTEYTHENAVLASETRGVQSTIYRLSPDNAVHNGERYLNNIRIERFQCERKDYDETIELLFGENWRETKSFDSLRDAMTYIEENMTDHKVVPDSLATLGEKYAEQSIDFW